MATQDQLMEAYNRLKGKKLVKKENSYDKDYSGGSSYYEKSINIYLYEDQSLLYQINTFVRASAAGYSLPNESTNEVIGSWDICDAEKGPVLVLKNESNEIFLAFYTQNGGVGIEYLDNDYWKRYMIE